MARLTGRLRMIDAALLVVSIAAVSLLLAAFLNRRVARPLASLVSGMQRIEGGELGIRVTDRAHGEFGFLITAFNHMVTRIEELTSGLEQRVRAATADLADKNEALQVANAQLWRAQLEISQSERLAAMGQLAGTLAHELGTPMNSVLGYIQLLQRDDQPAEQSAKLRIVESQIQRMSETIRSVLDRTRDVPLRRAAVAVAPLVAEAVALVSARAEARRVAVAADLPPGLPELHGDAVALRQVLLNLLDNALDATDGLGQVRVSAAVLSTEPQRRRVLELAITDTGHGMSADQIRCAFEPFYTTKAPGRGTGLGLVIVDHITRAHGGQVVVESTPGRGTTVRIRLPVDG
jgi:two-component system NtrC family sensor kinase